MSSPTPLTTLVAPIATQVSSLGKANAGSLTVCQLVHCQVMRELTTALVVALAHAYLLDNLRCNKPEVKVFSEGLGQKPLLKDNNQ